MHLSLGSISKITGIVLLLHKTRPILSYEHWQNKLAHIDYDKFKILLLKIKRKGFERNMSIKSIQIKLTTNPIMNWTRI